MDKQLNIQKTVSIFTVLAEYGSIWLHKVKQKDFREARQLRIKLNSNVTNPTHVVESFAKDANKVCSLIMTHIPVLDGGKKHIAYLKVFLNNRKYEFIIRRNKWVLIKY